jgi:hypothetical protein
VQPSLLYRHLTCCNLRNHIGGSATPTVALSTDASRGDEKEAVTRGEEEAEEEEEEAVDAADEDSSVLLL